MEIDNKSNNGIYIIMHAEEEMGQLSKKQVNTGIIFSVMCKISRRCLGL